MKTLRILTGVTALAVAITLFTGCKTTCGTSSEKLTPEEAHRIALDAYEYGYSLVTMEYTRRVMTNVREPNFGHAPMGWLLKSRTYPDASYKVVTAPNADTLYTTAWIDVSKEPYILSLPDADGRYYLMPMLDGWTDVFQVPGKRTTGTGPQKYAITGPGWTGTLPEGVVEYKSPTAMVWILGRIYCTGTPEDYDAVHKMQDEISLVPLSSYGQSYSPPAGEVDPTIDMVTPVRDQVNALNTEEFFNVLAKLMKDNPPTAADAPIVADMARLGIVPGQPFDASQLSPEVQQAIEDVPNEGFSQIMGWLKKGIWKGKNKYSHGWLYTTNTGLYGTDYLQRAFITAIGLGANRPQDAIYPTSEGPGPFRSYDGTHKYVMHFKKGELPPVKGFWSLTMYDAQYFFVANPLNRYTLSARDSLKPNEDGSIDLYIQHESPGADKESNWLPAPSGKFILMMRLYWPTETPPSILDGTWEVPEAKEQIF
ncbi:MAG TPA: DUF1254 domain-containing protein [Candidatus Acidoferrales bacterium]|nr:DUF1254 domain-containing protein [Candidatus Acidoferrales bacterium]